MQYSLEFAGLWDNTLLEKENPEPVAIVFKGKAFNNDAKLKRQEKHTDKIIFWTKNNVKYKGYISRMCLGYIQQKF